MREQTGGFLRVGEGLATKERHQGVWGQTELFCILSLVVATALMDLSRLAELYTEKGPFYSL